ncbi:MAG TPA: hypothetical protein VMD57_03530 [Candidatus Baltobacteraceae bacterium]|nr:hypothetical protein [Candidatus Baltobacteraceae bacterium]
MKGSRNHQSWADVAVFEKLSDAKVLEKFLTDHRLEARAYDDKVFRYFLFLRPPTVTYRVQVRANAFRAAVELLGRDAPAILEQALHCPSCGSLQVNYPQMTRKFIMPTVLLHIGIIFRALDHECYCESCHHVWNLPKDEAAGVHKAVRITKPFPF